MTPLDLRVQAPRACREMLFRYYMLPRTIDKLRAGLPGGHMGAYLNHDAGFGAYAVRKAGLDMDDFRAAVAVAEDEAAIAAWLGQRIDPARAVAVNAKLDSFVCSRMSPSDRAIARERHPVMASRPDLDVMLDIIDAEDRRAFAP